MRRCHHRTCSIRRAPHKPGIKTRRSGDDFSPYSASTAAQTYSVRVQHCSCHYTVHLHRRIMFDHLWPTYASTSINRGLVIFHVYLPSDLTAPPKMTGVCRIFLSFFDGPTHFFFDVTQSTSRLWSIDLWGPNELFFFCTDETIDLSANDEVGRLFFDLI